MSILDCVLLSQKGDALVFTTSTAEAQLTIPAPLVVVGGKFDKAVALPVGGITSFLSTLPDSVVTITLDENHTITMSYCIGSDDKVKEGLVSLSFQDGDIFPFLPSLKGDNITHIALPTDTLLNAIEQGHVFSAHDDIRHTLNTLCLDVSEDHSECYIVATDGRSLYKETYTADFFRAGQPRKIMVPNQIFRVLSAFSGCNDINVESDGQTLRFTGGNIEFLCKEVEGNYPNYNAVIPRNNPYYITVDKREMVDAVKRVSIFGNGESGLIKLEKNGMFINVSSANIDYATSSQEQVFISDVQCEDGFTIGLNATIFINALKAIDADIIRIDLIDPTRPCVCTAADGIARVLTLCMPMRIE